MLGCVEGDDADAEVANELAGQLGDVAVGLVLEPAVTDADGGVRPGGAGRQPVQAEDGLARDDEVEASDHHAVLLGLLDDLHVSPPGAWLAERVPAGNGGSPYRPPWCGAGTRDRRARLDRLRRCLRSEEHTSELQ